MQLSDEHTFAAPIDDVWAMFCDPQSHVKKFEDMGHRDVELLEATSDDESFRITVKRVVDVDLPGFAKRVLKPTNTVTTTDIWRRQADGRCTGEQQVETEGAPVKIAATTELTPSGDQTEYRVVVDLEVKVPLIGGRLADWAKGKVQEQLDDEFAAGDRWLQGER
jgi:hypothetical protein